MLGWWGPVEVDVEVDTGLPLVSDDDVSALGGELIGPVPARSCSRCSI